MEIKYFEFNRFLAAILDEETDPETGVISERGIERLAELELSKSEKEKSLVCVMKQKKAHIETLKALKKQEAERIDKLIDSETKSYERLGEYIAANGGNLKTDAGSVTFRKTLETKVSDKEGFLRWCVEDNHSEYVTKRTTITESPNKVAIKEAILSGAVIPFCDVSENLAITVK